jgi:hypothetical protein
MSKHTQNVQNSLIQIRSFYSKYIAALDEAQEILTLPIPEAIRQELDMISE